MPIIDNTTWDWSKFGGTSSSAGEPTTTNLLDSSAIRRAISGFNLGGTFGQGKTAPSIGFASSSTMPNTSETDWRVKISLAAESTILYNSPTSAYNGVLAPLKRTNGVVWPYTPSITVAHVANYNTVHLTHSNYAAQFFNNSEVSDITITGDFTVQSADDGQYLLAAIYFFRSATKMFFGQGDNMGNPPPMVFLDGYGSHYFPHVPCVISNFQHTLPSDVDYVPVPVAGQTQLFTQNKPEITTTRSLEQGINGGISAADVMGKTTYFGESTQAQTTTNSIQQTTRLPTVSQVSVTLKPIYSRKNLHERFNLEEFAQGHLLQDSVNGFGGFI